MTCFLSRAQQTNILSMYPAPTKDFPARRLASSQLKVDRLVVVVVLPVFVVVVVKVVVVVRMVVVNFVVVVVLLVFPLTLPHLTKP